MRLHDIQLREAARCGESKACFDIAVRLFSGTNGFAQNFKLGLAYLQEELKRNVPSAVMLVGENVPLEILMAQRCRTTLVEGARLGSPGARLKLGIWMALRRVERKEGTQWLQLSGCSFHEGSPDDAREISHFLKATKTAGLGDKSTILLLGARDALEHGNVQDACFCIRVAAELTPRTDWLAEVVSLTVQLVSKVDAELELPLDLVESSLRIQSERGEVEAQHALGCALGGLRYGLLSSQQLATREDARYAAALLLRAADAGKCEAWLNLSEMAPDYIGHAANRQMSRFFLEKAARSEVLHAQTKLGAILLREATSVEKAEEGVHWLSQAAGDGDPKAGELLQTLILPLPQLSPEYEKSVIEKARTVSPELGARMALARALHLTRREAMTFSAKPNIRPWGLFMRGTTKENPKGRLAPAVTPHMKSELQRAASFFSATSPIENVRVSRRVRTQQRQFFQALSISEALFFAEEIGRSWSHYGFGRHWAARAAPLLKTLLG